MKIRVLQPPCSMNYADARFDRTPADCAHASGILCNVFSSDDPTEAVRSAGMGTDSILIRDCLRVSDAVRARLAEKTAESGKDIPLILKPEKHICHF